MPAECPRRLRFSEARFLVMSCEGLKAAHLMEKFRKLPQTERLVASERSWDWGRR